MHDDIFCKIIRGEIPSDPVYQDDKVIVIRDIHPQAPVHLLIIPKEHVKEFFEVTDLALVQDLSKVAQKIIEDNHLHKSGYKIEINGGGRQDVDHLHIHLMGGK